MHRTFNTVIERIVDAIDALGLGEGDRLPNEKALASMLEVSRPTLRQALRVLETSGVIRVKQGQSGGIFVTADMIPIDLLGKNIELEVHHIEELIVTRRMLEPIVYHLAAENASVEQFSRIDDAIVLMHRHLDDPKMVQMADGMYHRRVAHAAGNEILLRTMNSIYRDLAPLRGSLISDAAHGLEMIDIHTRQLAAMRLRDHELLEQVLKETFTGLEREFNVASRFEFRWARRDNRLS